MEKQQQSNQPDSRPTGEENHLGQPPGQQLPPASGSSKDLDHPASTEQEVHHSASSFPQNDRETLGTP